MGGGREGREEGAAFPALFQVLEVRASVHVNVHL